MDGEEKQRTHLATWASVRVGVVEVTEGTGEVTGRASAGCEERERRSQPCAGLKLTERYVEGASGAF